ncbi:MAG TPA: 50S ribosomal protein L2 [archaeon]|nr:50S ribosomal protein L2 [archaeon]
MGKRIIPQKRGKGGPVWTATGRAKTKVSYFNYSETEMKDKVVVQVLNLDTDPVRSGVIAELRNEKGEKTHIIASEGLKVNSLLHAGLNAEIELGNILPLQSVPEGCPVFAVELTAGDGGKLLRGNGAYGLVITKDSKFAYIKLPSGKTKPVPLQCRATIGMAAGSGKMEKPLVKAGNAYFKFKVKGKLGSWPKVRGVKMNAVDHPFGGSSHNAGKSKSTSRHAPPGRKVGSIASSRTGRLKK